MYARRYPLVVISFAAMAGIAGDRYWSPPLFACCVAAGLALLIWSIHSRAGQDTVAAWWLLLSIAAAMGSWHHMYWRLYPPDHMISFAVSAPQPVVVRGTIASLPELTPVQPMEPMATIPRGATSRCVLEAMGLRSRDHRWLPTTGKLDLWVDGQLLGIQAGDTVEVYGVLSGLSAPQNPGEADTGQARRGERILCQLSVGYPECVRKLKSGPPSRQRLAGHLRLVGLSRLDQYVGTPRSALAGALLLGARDRLQRERTEAFFHTGTIHLLAISGLHVGILAWGFFLFARSSLRSRRLVLVLLMLFVVGYCQVTGMRAPVLRASILVVIICLGQLWNRRAVGFNSLAAAALLVLLFRPSELFRPGAQLSFLAVAALIWLSQQSTAPVVDPLDRLIYRARPWYQRMVIRFAVDVKRLWIAGLVVWLVTLPLVMMQFHLVSPIALVLNVVLAIPIVIGLISGFGVLVFGEFLPPVAGACGWICDASLAAVEMVVQMAEKLPGSYTWVVGPTPGWCLVFYAVLCLVVVFPQIRPARLTAIAGFSIWLTVPIAHQLIVATDPSPVPLRCTFLSVGHGTCVVMEMPNKRVLIYDAGRMGIPDRGVRIVSEYLWYRRISHIDGIIVSHADADHYNAVPGLLERFSVGQVFVSPVMFQNSGAGVVRLREALTSHGIPVHELRADDGMDFDGVVVEVLHPLQDGVQGSDNAQSIVIEVTYDKRKILLPGDLEPPGLGDVMAELPRDCDLLMAPHHGSPRSYPLDFVGWCSPEAIVISAREESKSHSGVFASTGSQVLHTSEVGAVTLITDGNELHIESFLESGIGSEE